MTIWTVQHLPYGLTYKPVEVAYFDTEAEAVAHEAEIRAGYEGKSEDARVVTFSLEVAS